MTAPVEGSWTAPVCSRRTSTGRPSIQWLKIGGATCSTEPGTCVVTMFASMAVDASDSDDPDVGVRKDDVADRGLQVVVGLDEAAEGTDGGAIGVELGRGQPVWFVRAPEVGKLVKL